MSGQCADCTCLVILSILYYLDILINYNFTYSGFMFHLHFL